MLILMGFPSEGGFPCPWPKCWSLGTGAGAYCSSLPALPPSLRPHPGRVRCGPVLPLRVLRPHKANRDVHAQGSGGIGVAECPRAVGRGRTPAGGEVCFSRWIREFVLEGRAFPACCEPPGIFRVEYLGQKRAFWVEEMSYKDSSLGKAQLDGLTG